MVSKKAEINPSGRGGINLYRLTVYFYLEMIPTKKIVYSPYKFLHMQCAVFE